jgi:hypothetical protein
VADGGGDALDLPRDGERLVAGEGVGPAFVAVLGQHEGGDGRDSRLVRLWLTDAGRALREPVAAERHGLEEKITAGLTEAEIRKLMTALGKVYESARALL